MVWQINSIKSSTNCIFKLLTIENFDSYYKRGDTLITQYVLKGYRKV